MHHMFLDTLIELWLFNRIWYLNWYDTINIYRRWILTASIQKQQDMSIWQTFLLEFNCVNICNWKMDRLIKSIHAMISLALRALRMDNLHASIFPKNFLSFQLDINCSSFSLKTLVRMFGWSYADKLRAEIDRWISSQYELQVNVKKKSGNPIVLQMVILSKYNWSMYLRLPTKDEAKTIRFPQLAC